MLYQEWEPKPHALAAIWHIEEEEAFFGDKTGLISQIKHPRKRLEHLCGRFLLQHLRQDFPLHHIAPDEHDKPRLPENRFYFSISHSYPYVAALISEQEECGIDIQVWKDSMEGVAHMFLSDEEQQLCRPGAAQGLPAAQDPADARLLTLAWCAKEAAYKWNGRRGADFIGQLPIQRIVGVSWDEAQPVVTTESFQVEMLVSGRPVSLPGWLHRDFACACLLGHRPA